MSKVSVKQDPEKSVPAEVMADAIVAISDGIKKLRASRLNDKALFMLIAHAAPTYNYKSVSQREVKAVIAGIESLEATYLKPTKKS